jgi:hypothetical protein
VFRNKLNEVAVFNSNLAYATRLFTEHSTSKQEKINILKRFDDVETIKESKNLYQIIKNELSSENVSKKPVNESIEKTITFDSSNREESQNVILYVDESQNLNSKKLFIDSLKKNETMMIQLSFSGCFTDGEETILVFKKGKKLYLNYHNKVKKLKKREIEAIKVYENELRNLPEACFMSTANSFHKVSLNSQEFTYSEPSSFWGGFEILKKRLRLDSVNQ